MQTFVPCLTFERCAQVLDYRRLGKQRVECEQILDAITYQRGWYKHAACRMWEDYVSALMNYQREIIHEWIRRGYRNTMWIPRYRPRARIPNWWGSRIHRSHRIALLHKNPDHYLQYWRMQKYEDYYWPE